MAVKTQNSQLFGLFPSATVSGEHEVLRIECINNFNGGGNPADNIVVECLDKTTRDMMKGMRTPGQATFTIDADPRNDSHIRLHDSAESDAEEHEVIRWALGWSDGPKDAAGENTALPALNVDGDDFELPSTRTWFLFEGYVADFPFDFAANTTVKTAVAIQRSGRGAWVRKVVTP